MPSLTPGNQDILQATKFDETVPGSILADFETLLAFIGPGGINSGGKNLRIPLAALSNLDERMTHPLRPQLTRPQQLSYPHLNGLYLLLRSTGIGISSGQGASGRLSLNPPVHSQWVVLNAVEKYMTLFEAMLNGNWSMVSSNESDRSGPFQDLPYVLVRSEHNQKPQQRSCSASELFYCWSLQTTAALLELFGILDIQRATPVKGENWRIQTIQVSEFGEAFLTKFRSSSWVSDRFSFRSQDDDETPPKWMGDYFRDVFPDCQNTLQPVESPFVDEVRPFVDGIWQFKVMLDDAWRRIQVPADLSAEMLVSGILHAFKFDMDHLFQLQMRDRSGQTLTIGCNALDDVDAYCDEFMIGQLPLDPGKSMLLHYDFGDDWRFKVKLEKILPPNKRMKKLKITERLGKAPKQYTIDDEVF